MLSGMQYVLSLTALGKRLKSPVETVFADGELSGECDIPCWE